ncbi:MAG: N(4)-(beta-N-acetylglucosaminyl)-L-asparaginase [Acidobacteria bacterium]|nr:N(4)-(beta-N-acetylglucosaminyl)-L-asparaginase [Acidobacteriota bacterium]MBK8810532.1 N(4)-(beta-N-acetylglucosaminyl)-L-asparaginase [Acidobacteriota bacterium]
MIDRRKFIQTSILSLLAAETAFSQDQNFELRSSLKAKLPVVVSTWDSGIRANAAAWRVLGKKGRALDAVEQAARSAEDEISCCVGLGALPDRDGIVTLDASIMDEFSNCGSVAYLRRIKNPISVARKLMETTPHVFLAGEGAEQFAVANGFERHPEKLSPESEETYKKWLRDSKYKPVINIENMKQSAQFAPYRFEDGTPNHDTMGTIAIDANRNLSGACTTSGMAFKMHGRVGDSPIIGAGLFVDNEIGAATSSGVGEEVIRICGTHLIIELMRNGKSPENACKEAVDRIVKRDPEKAKTFQVGFIALSKRGEIGAYSIQPKFSFSVTNDQFPDGKIFEAKSRF